jgi:hypothetical protein
VFGPPACCQGQCDAEINRWEQDVRAHETARRDRGWEVVAQADASWRDRPFSRCASDQLLARKALSTAVRQAIFDTAAWIEQSVHGFDPPSGPPVDCSRCAPSTAQNWCENGTCRTCNGNRCPTATGWDGCCPPSNPNCCERSCCRDPYSICCGGGTNACCPPSHPYCKWDPYYGVICGRYPSASAAPADQRGPQFVRAYVAPKNSRSEA